MDLPFLKNKRRSRRAPDQRESLLINGSADDHLDDHCMAEIFEACQKKDTTQFRSAIEALVMNMFEASGDDAHG